MNHDMVSAVFDTRLQAENAVNALRAAGVEDGTISIISHHDGLTVNEDGAGTVVDEDEGAGFVKGMLGGGAIGAIAGIAALAIPGVGPFVAAGAIAQSAIGGAALTGAVVGATAGSVMGYMAEHGVDKDDAEFYAGRLESGGTFVSVDTSGTTISPDTVLDIMNQAGGQRRVV